VLVAAVFDAPVRARASNGVRLRWRTALDELTHEGLAQPRGSYAENRTFWTTLEVVAVALDDVGAPLPSDARWSALIGELAANARRNAGPSGDGPFGHFAGVKTWDDLYLAQFKYLRDQRGVDQLAAPPGMAGGTKPIPRTTNADVIALSDFWGPRLDDARAIMGRESVVKRWRGVTVDVDRLARDAPPGDVYAKNNEFWRALLDTAIHIALADEAPTTWDLAKASLAESVTHIPQNLGLAVQGVAHAVGNAAGEVGNGLASGLRTPLLVGAGVLGALLLMRGRGKEAS